MERDDIEGWKAIAVELGGVNERTAERYAKRNRDPLPVSTDHRGWVCISRTALRDWVNRQRMAYQTHCDMRSAQRSTSKRKRSRKHAESKAA